MTREIVIDTETTGFGTDDRICEIACVELIDGVRTGNLFQSYVNPEKESHHGALACHGLTTQFLSDKPTFIEIVDELAKFILICDTWVMHNAPFDTRFLKQEWSRLERILCIDRPIVCTLKMGKSKYPLVKQGGSLNNLCNLYNIDTSHRGKHGALVDAELTAELYLRMKGCRE